MAQTPSECSQGSNETYRRRVSLSDNRRNFAWRVRSFCALFYLVTSKERAVWHKPVSASEPFRMPASLWGGPGIALSPLTAQSRLGAWDWASMERSEEH